MPSWQVSTIIGQPLGPNLTVNEIHDRLGPLFTPSLVWLAAGVTATAGGGRDRGGGDAHWLRQFDVEG